MKEQILIQNTFQEIITISKHYNKEGNKMLLLMPLHYPPEEFH